MFTPLFAATCTVAKIQKQPQCPLVDDWMKMYVHTMDCHSDVKKNEILPFVTTPMDL